MYRHYTIERIEGLPPKKDGANSMWNKPSEFERLITLRRAVCDAFNGDKPLHKDIQLRIRVHVGNMDPGQVGDLDNFITGVCDGLMAARGSMHCTKAGM
jgi:hypothetical protein